MKTIVLTALAAMVSCNPIALQTTSQSLYFTGGLEPEPEEGKHIRLPMGSYRDL